MCRKEYAVPQFSGGTSTSELLNRIHDMKLESIYDDICIALPLRIFCTLPYRVAQCKKPHTIAEELILPCAIDMVSTMLDDTAASVRQHHRHYDMSKEIEEQLNDKVRDSRFSLQMDEATDSNKDCLLIT